MGQKSRATSGSPGAPGAVERRRKDKTVAALDGLVADLARRTQSALEGIESSQHFESIKGIHRLLMQIQKLERPFVHQKRRDDVSTRLQVLHSWLRLQGVHMEGLRLQGGLPEGAGVVATQAFEKGQLLCTVPAHVMMTTATAIRSKNDVGLLYKADPILRQMPALILALHLLFEKHRPADEPSLWVGYIDSLPGQGGIADDISESSDSFVMPLAFSLEAIKALEGTAVLVEMHKAVRNYARQYAHVRLLLRQLKGQSAAIDRAIGWFTWAEFRWAASIVMTRQNPIPGTPDLEMGQALALIPLLDMFNHEEGEITCHFAIKEQQMELIAKRQFGVGNQVYISYGYRPNSALLLYSGFVPDHNSKDRIKVPVELNPSDPLYQKKASLLKWLELPASGWLELYHDGTPSPELATWIKVVILQDPVAVTENLKAAIASRAEETAAILQYKAALREAEEKARNCVQQGEATDSTGGDGQKVPEVETEAGKASEDGKVNGKVDYVVVNGHSHSNPENSENSGSRSEEDSSTIKKSEKCSIEDNTMAQEIPETPESSESGPFSPTKQYLGEHLLPAEVVFLADICRMRLSEFGGKVKTSGVDEEAPRGLGGLGLVGGQKGVVQSKNRETQRTRELMMVLKIRRQEEQTLFKAMERGLRYQHSHTNECRHHCC